MVFVVADAIQKQAILLIAKAGKGIGRRSALLHVGNIYQLGLRRNNARSESQKFREVAAIQRKILDRILGAKIPDT